MKLLPSRWPVYMMMVLLVITCLADAKREQRRRVRNKRPKKQKSRTLDADKFLEKFGYMGHLPEDVHHSPEARREAIKNFQLMVGLPVTGRLDADTRAKMVAPRCGMPDMVPVEQLPPPGVALDPNQSPENFYVPGYKWEKKDLTWAAHSYSVDFDSGSQRRAFYNAFQYWSDVSPLTFNEVSAADADIDINFNRRDHGDGAANAFDGPGGTLAHAFYPENGDTHFDEDEHWTQQTSEGINLEIVAAHEFGHALGLGHSNVPTALMAPYYQGYDPDFKLHQDDIWGIQTLYGGKEAPTTPRPNPSTTTRPPTGNPDKDPCTTKFGAVFQAHDARIYVINKKYVYRLNDYGLDEGYPKRITKVYDQAPYNIGAATYSWATRYTYFFKGKKIFKYYGFSRVEKKTVKTAGYPDAVQAAYMGRDGHIYLFKDSRYWIFDETLMDVTSGSLPISSMWSGIPSNIESAVRLNDGYIYFFKGAKYRKYDEYYDRVLDGYPKEKAVPWMGSICGRPYEPK